MLGPLQKIRLSINGEEHKDDGNNLTKNLKFLHIH